MAKIQNILIIILIIAFVSVFIITINYIKEIEKGINYNLDIENSINFGEKYHFAFIVQNIDDLNWLDVKNGVIDAAKKYKLSIEFNGSKNYDLSEQKKFMDIAINSKVDGIILYVTNEEEITPLINQAVDKGIPVITMGKEAVKSKRAAYIATPNYKTGIEAAKELISIKNKNLDVAVIIKKNKGGSTENEISEDVVYNGFKNTIKDFSNIKIDQIHIAKDLLDSSKITREIIREGKVNAIFCTGAEETVIVVQTIVDLNSVNKITTIGLGDNSEILRLIDNGIIKASIVNNQYKIGYDGIEQLVNIKKKNHISTFIDISVSKIDKDNIKEYIAHKSNLNKK